MTGLEKRVTLCRWSAKQTIHLSVLARNKTKGLDSSSRGDRKWVREHERNWTKGLREGSWRRVTRVGSRHRTAEVTSWHERESSSSEGRPVKMRQHSSWVVEFSLEIHASVSLHMHKGMQCYITPLLALSVNPSSYCSFVLCSFLSLP